MGVTVVTVPRRKHRIVVRDLEATHTRSQENTISCNYTIIHDNKGCSRTNERGLGTVVEAWLLNSSVTYWECGSIRVRLWRQRVGAHERILSSGHTVQPNKLLEQNVLGEGYQVDAAG